MFRRMTLPSPTNVGFMLTRRPGGRKVAEATPHQNAVLGGPYQPPQHKNSVGSLPQRPPRKIQCRTPITIRWAAHPWLLASQSNDAEGVALHPESASLGHALAGFVTDASGPRRGNHTSKVSRKGELSTTQSTDQVDSIGRMEPPDLLPFSFPSPRTKTNPTVPSPSHLSLTPTRKGR